MNTTEVNVTGLVKDFKSFWDLTKKQFIHYENIEGRDWGNYDFCIDTPEDQLLLKDMLQVRMVEELAEANEAYLLNQDDHYKEEIADAVNFFMAAVHMSGLTFEGFPDQKKVLDTFNPMISLWKEASQVIYEVHHLCNILKNRPWSQSNYLVSLDEYNERWSALWNSFWTLIFHHINVIDLFEVVERKYLVNQYRIETGY